MSVQSVVKIPYATAGFGDDLTHDLAQGVPTVLNYFPARQWEGVARQIDLHTYPREELCSILERSAEGNNAPAAVRDNIRILADPRTYVVATGQQAGFMGGPLYVLHKALSAIKLARQFEREAAGRARFVPVFWVAGDDHDLAEIDHADFLKENGGVKRVRPTLSPESAGCSACDAFLDLSSGNINILLLQLKDLFQDESVTRRYLDLYQGRSLSQAFAMLLLQWLGEFGLIVAQSSELRVLGKALLLRDLDEYEVVSGLVQEAGLSLRKNGYTPGFSKSLRVAPHFYISSEPGKVRAKLEPVIESGIGNTGLNKNNGVDEFRESSPAFEVHQYPQRYLSRHDLSGLLSKNPQLFSASAVLRPILQNMVFPVVAAVLGPGEIAYWAQLKPVHDHFDVVWPMVLPRASLTLIDAKGGQMIQKLGLEPCSSELFSNADTLRKKVLKSGELALGLGGRASSILAEFDMMEAEVHEVDRGLKPLFQKARQRIEHELLRIAEKTNTSMTQRENAADLRLHYVSSLIRPGNSPQERVLTTAQFMQKYPALAHDLLDVIDPAVLEHLVVTLK